MKCVICQKEIEENFDRWVVLTDFNKGRIVSDCYYHLECWKDRFKITNSKRKKEMYAAALESIKKIKDNLLGKFGDGGISISS